MLTTCQPSLWTILFSPYNIHMRQVPLSYCVRKQLQRDYSISLILKQTLFHILFSQPSCCIFKQMEFYNCSSQLAVMTVVIVCLVTNINATMKTCRMCAKCIEENPRGSSGILTSMRHIAVEMASEEVPRTEQHS